LFRSTKADIPRWYRDPDKHTVGWEIFNWRYFHITINIKSIEIHINKWP